MGAAFNLIGNAAGTTNRAGGQIGAYFAANRAARAVARSNRETLGYAQSKEEAALDYLDPYSGAGEQALSPLLGLLTGKKLNSTTGEYDSITPEQRLDLFQTSPGYQFRINEAQKAIQNSQAARGNLLSGGAMKELQDRSQGMASDEYNNYISQLGSLAGMGQAAATNQASIVNGNIGALSSLYQGGLNSTYQAQKYQNLSNLSQSLGETFAQHHENAGNYLSQMFGGGGMGGGAGGMMGGMGG